MRVLVVENDDRVARALVRALRHEGCDAHRVTGVAQALEAVAVRVPDLALVDLGLDDGDGIEVVRALRDLPATGVVVVTARGAEVDRVRGLRAGADDYLVKPFSPAELMARIEAVSRRLRVAHDATAGAGVLRHGRLELDPAVRRVVVDGDELSLTPTEFAVLELLLHHAGAAVERHHVVDHVWRSRWEPTSRTLDTHMASLRAKLGDAATIRTLRGVGYRLEAALDPGGD